MNIERQTRLMRPAAPAALATGRRSCFYRKVALGGDKAKLVFD